MGDDGYVLRFTRDGEEVISLTDGYYQIVNGNTIHLWKGKNGIKFHINDFYKVDANFTPQSLNDKAPVVDYTFIEYTIGGSWQKKKEADVRSIEKYISEGFDYYSLNSLLDLLRFATNHRLKNGKTFLLNAFPDTRKDKYIGQLVYTPLGLGKPSIEMSYFEIETLARQNGWRCERNGNKCTVYPNGKLWYADHAPIYSWSNDTDKLFYKRDMPEENLTREVLYWYEFGPKYGVDAFDDETIPELNTIQVMLRIEDFEVCKNVSQQNQNFFLSKKQNVIIMRRPRNPNRSWDEVVIASDYNNSEGKGNISIYVGICYLDD